MGFKDEFSFETRLADSTMIREKFPDRLPVVLEKAPRANLPSLDKTKFLVPKNLTVGQFMYVINRRMDLKPGQALFMFVGKVLPQTGSLMMSQYNDHKDKDGFLYMMYSGEDTFGAL